MSGLTRESLVINLSVQRQGDFVVFDIKTMQDVLQIKKQKELISALTRLILFTFGREHKIQGCLKPPELQEEYDRLFAQVEQIHACLRGEKLLHEAMQGVLSSHSRFEGRQKEDYSITILEWECMPFQILKGKLSARSFRMGKSIGRQRLIWR
jgi:hypothetical protein